MKAVEAHEAINGSRSSTNLLNGGGQDQGFYPHKATLLAEAVQEAKLQAFAVDDGRTKRFGFGTFLNGICGIFGRLAFVYLLALFGTGSFSILFFKPLGAIFRKLNSHIF